MMMKNDFTVSREIYNNMMIDDDILLCPYFDKDEKKFRPYVSIKIPRYIIGNNNEYRTLTKIELVNTLVQEYSIAYTEKDKDALNNTLRLFIILDDDSLKQIAIEFGKVQTLTRSSRGFTKNFPVELVFEDIMQDKSIRKIYFSHKCDGDRSLQSHGVTNKSVLALIRLFSPASDNEPVLVAENIHDFYVRKSSSYQRWAIFKLLTHDENKYINRLIYRLYNNQIALETLQAYEEAVDNFYNIKYTPYTPSTDETCRDTYLLTVIENLLPPLAKGSDTNKLIESLQPKHQKSPTKQPQQGKQSSPPSSSSTNIKLSATPLIVKRLTPPNIITPTPTTSKSAIRAPTEITKMPSTSSSSFIIEKNKPTPHREALIENQTKDNTVKIKLPVKQPINDNGEDDEPIATFESCSSSNSTNEMSQKRELLTQSQAKDIKENTFKSKSSLKFKQPIDDSENDEDHPNKKESITTFDSCLSNSTDEKSQNRQGQVLSRNRQEEDMIDLTNDDDNVVFSSCSSNSKNEKSPNSRENIIDLTNDDDIESFVKMKPAWNVISDECRKKIEEILKADRLKTENLSGKKRKYD